MTSQRREQLLNAGFVKAKAGVEPPCLRVLLPEHRPIRLLPYKQTMPAKKISEPVPEPERPTEVHVRPPPLIVVTRPAPIAAYFKAGVCDRKGCPCMREFIAPGKGYAQFCAGHLAR